MKIGDFEALEPEVMNAMFDMFGNIKAGDVHIELGAGNGQFVQEGLDRGLASMGYEIDETLALQCQAQGLNVIHGDFFDYDLSPADLVTFWFTDNAGLDLLIQKLYADLSNNTKVVALFDSITQYRDGILVPEVTGIPTHPNFAPVKTEMVIGNRICYYRV